MIITVVNMISSGTSLILVNYFFSSQKKRANKWRIDLLLSALFLSHIILSATIENSKYAFSELALVILIYLLLGQRNEVPIRKNLFWSLILLGVSLVSEYISFLIMSPFVPVQLYAHQEILTAANIGLASFIEIISVILLKFLAYRKSNDGQQLSALRILAFSSIPIVSILLLYTLLLQTANSPEFPFLLVFIFFVGLIIVNLSVIYLYMNLSRQYENYAKTSTEKDRLEQEIKFYEQTKQSQQEIRAVKHDLRNQLIVLLNKLENGEVKEAENTINQALSLVSLRNSKILSEHQALNFLLNEKSKRAEASGVVLNVKSFIPQTLIINDEVLVAVFGNLLDNAIQACERLKTEEQKEIDLKVTFFKGRLTIEISNPFNPEEEKTRKIRLVKGIGRRNIAKVVEKNGGLYESWRDGAKYFVNIILFNISYKSDVTNLEETSI